MKYCKDCKHCNTDKYSAWICEGMERNPVDSRKMSVPQICSNINIDGHCGLWESKEKIDDPNFRANHKLG